MTTALIIGSGPAAAGAALALSRREDLKITVIDIGLRLETERQQQVDRLASSDPSQWDAPLVERVSEQPVDSRREESRKTCIRIGLSVPERRAT